MRRSNLSRTATRCSALLYGSLSPVVKADTRASPREKRAALAQHQRADRHPNANASQQHKHHGAQTIGPEYLFIAPVKIAGQPARLRTPARPVAAAMPAAPPRGAL
jgi:hypothetical protein